MKKEDLSARRKRLLNIPKSAFDGLNEQDYEEIESLSLSYKDLLDSGKTVRQAVEVVRGLAEQWSFKPYERGMELKPGDKIYSADRNRDIFLAVIGQKPLSEGIRLAASHLDSPSLDLKPNPLYEEDGQALLKTHYYGGVKKYQWLARPLELRGVVARKDGSIVEVQVGADPYDPVLVINDLLPHLSAEQYKKTIGDAITGEQLNALVGLRPDLEEGDDRVKLAVLSYLNEKYNITEEDFLTAELSIVPATNARDVGFDRSMIGAYGHDDKSCAYAALDAILRTEKPAYTSVCALTDKEEIGSEGVSGMRSAHFDSFVGDLCDSQNVQLRHCYQNSFCFSGDVVNAFDPNFSDAHDKRNNGKIGYGACIFKYTGSRGKGGSSEASCETMVRTRRLLDKAGVRWQVGELGKIDLGGGGTVAKFIAERNIDVVDIGVPVLSMHAPYEVIAKVDLWMLRRAFSALFGEK
ncbi:M18 family aminopeptidase [Clostridia bacterium]|nr:M18 family aminopeptidase [Clostridia bacterium]